MIQLYLAFVTYLNTRLYPPFISELNLQSSCVGPFEENVELFFRSADLLRTYFLSLMAILFFSASVLAERQRVNLDDKAEIYVYLCEIQKNKIICDIG